MFNFFNTTTKSPISEYFKGENIINTLKNSVFGKISEIFESTFTDEEIENYQLPKVIVIGNESTGKSSLLENITKCQLFPRKGSSCTTKCPIVLKLDNGEKKYRLEYDNKKYGYENMKKNFENEKDLFEAIEGIFNSIPSDIVVEEEIIVHITDKHLPKFEFYDLPGITAYPENIAKTTENISKKYLSDKNAIVLCVVEATRPRLSSCQSIALINEMGMNNNTILALTMVDRLCPVNYKELLIDRLCGENEEINKLNFYGYVATCNRSHDDTVSLIEQDKIEYDWFKNNILSKIPDGYQNYYNMINENSRVEKILYKMDELYNKFIQTDWKPKIKKMLNKKIKKFNDEISNLGEYVTDENLELYNNIIKNEIDNGCEELIIDINKIIDDFDCRYNKIYKYPSKDELSIDIKKIMDKINSQVVFQMVQDKLIKDIFTIKEYPEDSELIENDDMYDYGKYKIYRFSKIMSHVLVSIKENFDAHYQERYDILIDYLIDHINWDIIIRMDYTKKKSLNKIIFETCKRELLQDIMNIDINFKVEDYQESHDYVMTRKNLEKELSNLTSQIDKIDSITNKKIETL